MATITRSSLAAVLVALCAALFTAVTPLDFGGIDSAYAQSSVRPPSNATSNAVPGAGEASQPAIPPRNQPGRPPIQPPNLKDGAVPGGSLGTRSSSEIWRQIREGKRGTVPIPDKQAGELIRGTNQRLRNRDDVIAAQLRGGAEKLNQDQTGINSWLAFRSGPMATYGLYAMGGMLAALLLFFLIRGRIKIEHGPAGTTIQRFNTFERTGHWLLAISFIILAITGLNLLYGRDFLIPLLGKETFAAIAYAGKLTHNYVAFAFMLGLAMIFITWVKDNFPHPRDLAWLAKGGGLFVKGVHPSSKKFNAGQKVIFWLVILGGVSISMSGIALMFPFETTMFAKTFTALNTIGFDLPTQVSALDEQKYASLWHSIMALFLICVILAHIYIGSVGMEGAFDAMGTGQVDLNWAREHHDLWAEEAMKAEDDIVRDAVAGGTKVQPAE